MNIETNPGPLKYALSRLGLTSAKLRLPLVEPSERSCSDISAVLEDVTKKYHEGMAHVGALASQMRTEACNPGA